MIVKNFFQYFFILFYVCSLAQDNNDISPPNFSLESGFFNETQTLILSHPNPEVQIFYTLDGSEPDINNLDGSTYHYKNQYPQYVGQTTSPSLEKEFVTYTYSSPITLNNKSTEPNDLSLISSTYESNPNYFPDYLLQKAHTVRAKAYAGNIESTTVTKTYFVSQNNEFNHTLPIINITTNPAYLFDYEEGIYVAGKDFDDWRIENASSDEPYWGDANYKRRGVAYEIPSNFQYFENQELILNQDIGVRIQGGFSRNLRSKSLRLYARSIYDSQNSFNHSFFENNHNSFKRLILRNSGNDFYNTYFRDALMQGIVKNLSFDTQDYQPVNAYLNGEYWGLLNLRERYDHHYIKRVYGIDEEDLDLLYFNGFVDYGDNTHYFDLFNFFESNSLNDPDNYTYIQTQMDIENFSDYFISNIFFDNRDWPGNNIKYFRKKTNQYNPNAPLGHDGRWRWLLFDTDYGFGYIGLNDGTFNTLDFVSYPSTNEWPNPNWSTMFLRKLLENTAYNNYFINRFADLLNTTFLSERMNQMILTYQNQLAPEILNHINRWNLGNNTSWQNQVDVLHNFANVRPQVQRNQLAQRFNLSDQFVVNLFVDDIQKGYLKINTIELNEGTDGINVQPNPWNGIYFSDVPITITAIPKEGFVFSHWSGDVENNIATIELFLTEDLVLTAHFIEGEETNTEDIIYFWMMDNELPNDTPLTSLAATFEIPSSGVLNFQSCFENYPYHSSHPLWRKASMERRNSPTIINYQPEANNEIPFVEANMRGLQIKQPFQDNGLENTMIFDVPTTDYENIVFAFAAKNENAVDQLIIDYAINEEVVWSNEGLTSTVLALYDNFQLYEVDFSNIDEIKDNPNFKIRMRFQGSDMTLDQGNRVTFNNFSLQGTKINLSVADIENLDFQIYPNPVNDILHVNHPYTNVSYSIYSFDGKLIQQDLLRHQNIEVSRLMSGVYFIVFEVENKKAMKKIIKK